MTMGEGKFLCVKTEESGWDKGLSWLLLPDEIPEWRWLSSKEIAFVWWKGTGFWAGGREADGRNPLLSLAAAEAGLWIGVRWNIGEAAPSLVPTPLSVRTTGGSCGFPLGWPGALCSPCSHHVHTPHPWPPSLIHVVSPQSGMWLCA